LELGLRLSRLIPSGTRSGLLTHIAAAGKRFVVRADEKPTAFLELESAISGIALSCLTRFAASRFLLCSLTTNRPFALIHHGRTWSGGGANRISTSSERKIRWKVRSARLH
jgi:hypothetical protein